MWFPPLCPKSAPTLWLTSPLCSSSCCQSRAALPPLPQPMRVKETFRMYPVAQGCPLGIQCQCPVVMQRPQMCRRSGQPTQPQLSSDTSLWMKMVKREIILICYPFIYSLCLSGWNRGSLTIHTLSLFTFCLVSCSLSLLFLKSCHEEVGDKFSCGFGCDKVSCFFFSLKWPEC